MYETFGNSLLGLGILMVLMWALFYPQSAGEWVRDFNAGMESIAQPEEDQ